MIAVDGGGTRCRVAVRDGSRMVAVETGSANASTDFDGAVRQILQGLEELARRIRCPLGTLHDAPTFVGLAGVTGTDLADRLREALPFNQVRIKDDRLPAVRGALGGRDGVLGHCGTGSFFGAQIGGTVHLAGGWGPILGDEASANWAGRTALGLTLETVDGRLPSSPLCDRLLSEFSGAAGIVGFAGTAQPSEFGAIAPLVTEFAGRGDVIAQRIMHQGGEEISRAVRHLGWQPGLVVCLTGGIGPQYKAYLPEDLCAGVAEPEAQPLDGALSLALEFAEELNHERS